MIDERCIASPAGFSLPGGPMSVRAPRKKFTVEQYHQMAAMGILTERDRVELIEGEIVQMSPVGPRHAICVDRLNKCFSRNLPLEAVVRVQSPIHLRDDSEPQPDLTIFLEKSGSFLSEHPRPEEILAAIEVSDTTIEYDRQTKAPLYAREGIQELWIVNCNELAIAVYRSPSPTGYQDVQSLRKEQSLAFQAFPDTLFTIEQLLADFF